MHFMTCVKGALLECMGIDCSFHLLSVVLLSAGFITYLQIFQLVLCVEVRRQSFVIADV